MSGSHTVRKLLVSALVLALCGGVWAQNEQQQTGQVRGDIAPGPGEGEVFVFTGERPLTGDEDNGREAAGYAEEDWATDRFGTYYRPYWWQAADAGFEAWYGEKPRGAPNQGARAAREEPGTRGSRDLTRNEQARGVVVEGELLDTMKVTLKGADRTHTLIRLRSHKDEVTVVDVGAEVPAGLDLEQGRRMTVQGLPARINGRPVVVARRLIQASPGKQEQGRR